MIRIDWYSLPFLLCYLMVTIVLNALFAYLLQREQKKIEALKRAKKRILENHAKKLKEFKEFKRFAVNWHEDITREIDETINTRCIRRRND